MDIKKNPNVCFEFDQSIELVRTEKPCSWGMNYQSVIGYGEAFFIEKPEEKRMALNAIMEQYSQEDFSFQDAAVDKNTVFKVVISKMKGKQSRP